MGENLRHPRNKRSLTKVKVGRLYMRLRAPRKRRKQKRETRGKGMQNSLIWFSTVGAPTLLIKNVKPLLQECAYASVSVCVCVCAHFEGDGDRVVWGAGGVGAGPHILFALPNGHFVHCPLCFTTTPAPFLSPLSLLFRRSSFRVSPIVANEGTDLLKGGLGSPGSHCQVISCWS